MSRIVIIVATAAIALAPGGRAVADEAFEKAVVFMERNIQDGDAEVLIGATGGNAGLTSLKVVAPDGRTVVDFKAPDSRIGMRTITVETPEPRDVQALKADFPEGVYKFTGGTGNGGTLRSEARLTHGMPPGTTLVNPRPDGKNVPVTGLQVRWSPVANLAAWQVTIENEAAGRDVRATLLGTANSFAVPDGFLEPGTKYKVAIGAVGKDGNKSFVESDFTTAPRK